MQDSTPLRRRIAHLVVTGAVVLGLPAVMVVAQQPAGVTVRTPGEVRGVTAYVRGNDKSLQVSTIGAPSYDESVPTRVQWWRLRKRSDIEAGVDTAIDSGIAAASTLENLVLTYGSRWQVSVPQPLAGINEVRYSFDTAAIVGARASGQRIRARGRGVVLDHYPLLAGGVIARVNGVPVRTALDIDRVAARVGPGGLLRLEGDRGIRLSYVLPDAGSKEYLDYGAAAAPFSTVSLVGEFERPAIVQFENEHSEAIGRSASLAGALAAVAATTNLDANVTEGVAATGHVMLNGSIAPVSGIEPKVGAAHAAGYTTLVVPWRLAERAKRAAKGTDVRIVPARTITEAVQLLGWLEGGAKAR